MRAAFPGALRTPSQGQAQRKPNPPRMKFACSSISSHERLSDASLTQIEWLEHTAVQVQADGAVFDLRHFPRTDTDYLAQIKKMATDLCVTVAAFNDNAFFFHDEPHMLQSVEMALALGSPLLTAPLPPDTDEWTSVQHRLSSACSLAKRFNVTLAIRNAKHTHGATTHDLKNVAKFADSAWLRFGPELDALAESDDPHVALNRAVIVHEPASEPSRERVELLRHFRGFVVVNEKALAAWRSAVSEANRT